MVNALKPKSKRSLGGLGHDMADEFTNQWWHRVYNNATSNIKVNYSFFSYYVCFENQCNLRNYNFTQIITSHLILKFL